ncbi:hypothetical protein DPMN_049550 [Dreissena polymorpha]|uniref:Uncharacterized protein n=1 Tax=Dreissena polymorpha TaxID=45954 RepID=A0A9D4CGB7_DREPO|nr:hypothetical protein DPMN_049550 [Dreissena polymorpha]
MNHLTKFHEDWTINVASRVLTRFYYSHVKPYKKNAPPLDGHVFQTNVTIFELIQDILKTNLLTIFHQDWTKNVASRVLKRKMPRPLAAMFFNKQIIESNLLTKFHEDWTINVAPRELTRQMLTPHNGQRTTDKKRSQKLTMSTLCSGELKM